MLQEGNRKNLGKVKLRQWANAIKHIISGCTVEEACSKADISVNRLMCIKNMDPELDKIYYEAMKMRQDLDYEKVRSDVLNCDKDSAFPAKVKSDWLFKAGRVVNPTRYYEQERPPVNLEVNIGGELVTVKGGKK